MAIQTLLIANRGEIACRIARTCKSLGVRTIAIYSDADLDAPHVGAADNAIRIGPAPVADSYLDGDAILKAAAVSGADAVHPGYGFLSENADFAQSVQHAGLIWVGPPPDAIRAMGDKAQAKRAMIAAEVPCVPGYEGDDQSTAAFTTAAERIGYPVMVKAAAGGGGRGMRVVDDPAGLPDALERARSEAQNAFGNPTLILERAIQKPRHVEIQVFGDTLGSIIHLGERDCSIQRRHQKILEEAPCPVLTPELRATMGKAAVKAAQAVDYCGAGTVEFLLDENGAFYFLEMNTRLQVEHPVTEMVTGLDLVELQIHVAEGAPLGLAQDDIRLEGHAIEARVYAEDPEENFLPSTGKIELWTPPDGVRVDAGIKSGGDVSAHYDAMVAKLIAHGPTRATALRQLQAALRQTQLIGLKSNIAFLSDAISRPAFVDGNATTAFIETEYGDHGFKRPAPGQTDLIAAAIIMHLNRRHSAQARALNVPEELLDWSSSVPRSSVSEFELDQQRKTITVTPRDGNYVAKIDDVQIVADVAALTGSRADLVLDGVPFSYLYHNAKQGVLYLTRDAVTHVLINLASQRVASTEDSAGGRVTAPMHGRLISVEVEPGQRINRGDRLAVLEAMKMQHEIVAEVDGVVAEVTARPEQQIAANDIILEIDTTQE